MLCTLKHRRIQPRSAAAETTTVARGPCAQEQNLIVMEAFEALYGDGLGLDAGEAPPSREAYYYY